MDRLPGADPEVEPCYECEGGRSCIMCRGSRTIAEQRCGFCGGDGRCIVCRGAGQLPRGTWQSLVERGLIEV